MSMPSNHGKYCIIAPCRDEQDYAERTLLSLVRQTRRPDLVLVVDDGSTDQTPAILTDFSHRFDFINVITRKNRGRRQVGPGVIDAFYTGYDAIDSQQYEFICKLDLDLELPETYFENLITRMQKNPRLGTCSGKPSFPGPRNHEGSFDGPLISEACGDEMSVGMTKFYRRECFEAIGGFVREVMWDGIDCHRCRMLGWIAESYDDPELRFLHLRPMGSSEKGIVHGRIRHGFGQWFMGTSPSYMLASAGYRMFRPPFFTGGMAMAYGYFRSWVTGQARYSDKAFRKFLRDYQRRCLLHGKSKTVANLDLLGDTIWARQPTSTGRRIDSAASQAPTNKSKTSSLAPRKMAGNQT